MEIDLELKVKLYNEYLENGGIEKIVFPDLLDSLMKVKSLPNGKVDPATVDPLANAAMLAYVGTQLMGPFCSDKYLSEYETLLQKSIFFTQTNVETREEFDEVFHRYKATEQILFRGLNEARYRLYSSLQREWINAKLYDKHTYEGFLTALINNARTQQGAVLAKYLEKIGVDPDNDLAVLSFLQHYGCPTPLVDWTYSFPNALFFATQHMKLSSGKREIDKYFCVYYLEEEFFERASMQQVFDIGLKRQKEKLKNEFADYVRDSGVIEGMDKLFTPAHLDKAFYILHGKQLMTYMTKVEKLVKSPMLYFSDNSTDEHLRYNLNNNMNIVNQQGVFTWNANPTKPIEHLAFDERQTNEQRKRVLFSKCINIHKSLAPYVKRKIAQLGVTQKFIFPNAAEIARRAFAATK